MMSKELEICAAFDHRCFIYICRLREECRKNGGKCGLLSKNVDNINLKYKLEIFAAFDHLGVTYIFRLIEKESEKLETNVGPYQTRGGSARVVKNQTVFPKNFFLLHIFPYFFRRI